MSETMTLELTEKQRQLLLRGLSYVRSSIMLQIQDPTPEYVQQREAQLREVEELQQQLERTKANSAAQVR